jgi:hypothetical protein
MKKVVFFLLFAGVALMAGASCSGEQGTDGGSSGPCTAGTLDCGNAVCANILSDANNCGACGRVCTAGQTCGNGLCTDGATTTTGSGGSTGAGAASSSGGTGGSAGAAATGAGGSGGTGGGTGGTGGTASVTCTMNVVSDVSSVIPTVGIVTWSADLAPIDSAYIEFGPDENYGLQAPVDLTEPEYRTLLLGMTASSDYHFRVVATSGNATCMSQNYELSTGPVANGIAEPSVSPALAAEVAPGFLVTSRFTGGGGGGGEGQMYIYNQNGKLVWWYTPPVGGISRARMSYDGKYMIARDVNANGAGQGQVVRVSIDGLEEEEIDIPNGHHDFTVTPDNGIVFIKKAPDNCDEIVKLAADGTQSVIYTVSDAFGGDVGGGNDPCHVNTIQYNESDDSFTFSALNLNAYVKVTAAGNLVWVLGGNSSEFGGAGADWDRQHGHHMLADDRILFFNNGNLGGGGGGSLALEVLLDLGTMMATRVWDYDGDNSSQTLGDVQRLPNGNTLITYSNAGVTHEVNADKALVQEMTWPIGGAIGYVNHRPDLYGPPPR